MIDSKCNKFALELIHNRKVTITSQQTTAFSYIYQQIINISRNAPVYLIYPTDENQQFATKLKELSIELENYLENFNKDDTDNPFRRLRMSLSPSEFLSARLLIQPEVPAEYEVLIESVAAGQKNCSNYVSKGVCPFNEQTCTFTIQINEQSYDFELTLSNTISNEEILNKIAAMIHNTTENLEATVLYDGSKVALSIQASANRQNKPSSFTIKDTSTNGLVSYYALSHIDNPPQKSRFLVNNEEVDSYGIAFVIDDTIELTLHKPCTQTIRINFEPDEHLIRDEIQNLQFVINQLLSISYSSKKHTLEKEILQILLAHKEELAHVGIELNDSSLLQTDQEQLDNSIQDNSVQKLFDKDNGFAPELLEQTHDFIIDPMKYVTNKVVSYKDHSKANYPNPYLISMYSGFLFTSYC